MKATVYFIILLILCSFAFSCRTKLIHVPVQTEKTVKEYIDRWHKDSVHVKDSIIINKAGDTTFIEKYKYIYKDKILRDSIYITDSIKIEVPYPVEVIKERNRLFNWQIILMCLGGVLIGYLGFRIYKKIKI